MNIEIKKSIKPINYFNALNLLETRLENLSKNIERELIWTLEHDEIFTAGTSYLENEIIDKTIKIIKTNRGGKITCHGPGQLVCYFVLDLRNKKDIRKFITCIEKTIIDTLQFFKIETFADKNNKLVGMIMSDDILTVLKEEAEEDALRLAGVGDEEITDGVITKTKRRFNWLLLNLFTAFLATWCISLFGATIEQMVVLAFLMPIVASMGGNAGMQTLAVTVRTIATNDLTKNNFSSNVIKEFTIGILNGIIFAAISAFIVQIWFQDNILSIVISISMILTMIIAGLFGILIPVTLKKMNIDPAIASSVFVTTITDVIGFVSFLGVGAYFL